jgi:hypothetical protein
MNRFHTRWLRAKCLLLRGTAAGACGLVLLAAGCRPTSARIPFEMQVVDAGMAGDCKMLGDIDGDGLLDLVIGGTNHVEDLHWYHFPDWRKTKIAAAQSEFTTDGKLGDVDGDGDLDVVIPDGDLPDNLLWFENPRPDGDCFRPDGWSKHSIGHLENCIKDVSLADFDGDGRLDVAARNARRFVIFYQSDPGQWKETVLNVEHTGEEGMGQGDVDGDADMDLVVCGAWLRNPGGLAARDPAQWAEFEIGPASSEFKTLVVDLNLDGKSDVLFSSSEQTADVAWWERGNDGPAGRWTCHVIVPHLERCHTLKAADMDNDGDIDVVAGQMHTSRARRVMVLQNLDGKGTAWARQVIAKTGLHNGVVGDIDRDGDIDLCGSNWTGNPPIRVWINHSDPRPALDKFTYLRISHAHQRTFGLGFGDLDGDKLPDVVSGPFWYRNPGADLSGEWTQSAFPSNLQAFAVMNVDDDAQADVLAQQGGAELAFYWLKSDPAASGGWLVVRIGTAPATDHPLGAQGYRVAQLEPGGKPEVVISSGGGIFYFRVPDRPETGNWPRVRIAVDATEEGFGVGDLDADGDLDVVGTTGERRRVEWYINPGDGSGDWPVRLIDQVPDVVFFDRCEIADLNGDNRPDVLATEENGRDDGARTFWWQHPDAATNAWLRRVMVTQASTHSLDVADLDGDGDLDVVVGEHRGLRSLKVFENDGEGSFQEHVIDRNKESHLGARLVDLDGDGDLDIVSIAWDTPGTLHAWRNDCKHPASFVK